MTDPAVLHPIRVGGTTYDPGTRPGRVLGFGSTAAATDPNGSDARIYRVRRDYVTMSQDELRDDAAEVNEVADTVVTNDMMQAVLTQYETDWNQWPVAYGAPFIDRNGNGVYDPPPAFSPTFSVDDLIAQGYDEPGIAGADPDQPADQVIWTVYNDLDEAQTFGFLGVEPLGLEIQKTIWAYKRTDALGHVYFTRVRLLNKGGVDVGGGMPGVFYIDSMYVALWSDPDVGNNEDDWAGCDTLLNVGYAYNGNEQDEEYQPFSLPPPAVGYSIIEGPIVSSPGDTALRDFKVIDDHKNLSMTSFGYFALGSPYSDPPDNYAQGVIQWYKVFRGYAPLDGSEVRYTHPQGYTPGPFPLSGDPVSNTGFLPYGDPVIDVSPSDYRIVMSSGPFQLVPGDTQEVIVATIVGLGTDRLSSIAAMRANAQAALEFHNALYVDTISVPSGVEGNTAIRSFTLAQNYPNPFNPTTKIQFSLPRATEVSLKVYNLLGQEIAELVHSELQPGAHVYEWDGRGKGGVSVASGMYFYRLTANNFVRARTMILLK